MKNAAAVIVLALCLPGVARGAEPPERSANLLQEYDSGNPAYANADNLLNEVKLTTTNPEKARVRIDQLAQVRAKHPDYPFRYAVDYFLGMNYQVAGEYGQAADAFQRALDQKPVLASEMALDKRIGTLRRRAFARMAPQILTFVLLGLLALAAIPMLRKDRAPVPWKRLIAAYGAALVLWVLLVWLVPVLLGPPQVSGYPKPTLVGYKLGQMGHGRLVNLLGYGAGAIAAAFLVSVSFAGLRSAGLRRGLSLALVVLIVCAAMALYYVQNWPGQATFDPSSGRLTVLVKDISEKHEVPDEMLPLYEHERFRKQIREAKERHAREAE